ncbi:MAG: DUF1579 family protein [Candidatus Acidiferrum sp.]
MKKLAVLPLVILLILGVVVTIGAQDSGTPPKPGPEHAKLSYFAGKWISEGDMKPSPYGPGGKFTFTETCEWYSGNFALVCNSEGKMFGTTVKGMSIMSYDPGEKSYVYFETNNMGENNYSRGSVDGDTWTWTGESKMNGQTVHSRFTLKRISDDVSSYKFEMGAGSEPLALVMEGKQTRQK